MGKHKELHPADQQRKLERKKEKQRNAKQRKETRTNILKQKRPEQIIENLKKLELLDKQGAVTGNQAIKEHKHKRKQLLDAYDKCIEMWEEEYRKNPRLLQEGQGPQLGQLPKNRADLEKYLKQQVERLMTPVEGSGPGVGSAPTFGAGINIQEHPMLAVLFPFGLPGMLPLPVGPPPDDDDAEGAKGDASDSQDDSDEEDKDDEVTSKAKKGARPSSPNLGHPSAIVSTPQLAFHGGVVHPPAMGMQPFIIGGPFMHQRIIGMPPLPPGPPPSGLEGTADSDSGSDSGSDAEKVVKMRAEVNPALKAFVPASVRVQRPSAPKPSRPASLATSWGGPSSAPATSTSGTPATVVQATATTVVSQSKADDEILAPPAIEKPSRAVISAAPATRKYQAPVSLLSQLAKNKDKPDLDKEYQDFMSDLGQL